MNANFDAEIFSPSSQYLQDGGSQQPSMGTPRPGTPRGSYFRLSPDGNQNPGTPGASHDHHKGFPNSPWSGSEPATPGYNRNAVVPNSPYISSYPNTPATPGGGGFYQKPVNGIGSTMPPSNGAVVPPGSPWTDRSVCTPGPTTPLTPATPIPTSSDHGVGGSNGFGNNGSPTFQHDSANNNVSKALQQVPHQSPPHHSSTLAGLLQEGTGTDHMLPLPVMNHGVQPPSVKALASNQNDHADGLDDLPEPTFPLLPESDISQMAIENNPNLIAEFEDFFSQFLAEKNGARNQSQQRPPQVQQQQQQQQQQIQHQQQQQVHQQNPPPQMQPQQTQQQHPQLMNAMGMGNNGHPMMYNNNEGNMSHVAGQPQMMMSNNGHGHHIMNGMHNLGNSIGPMRQNKFNGHHNPHNHPYMPPNNNMMRGRPHPMQYGQPPQQQPQQNMQHHHANMGGNMNMMGPGRPQQAQYGQGHNNNPSASSVYAHPPSNGGYVQVRQQPMQPQHMGNPTYANVPQNQNPVPVHWQTAPPQHPQAPPQTQPQQQMSNLNNMMGTPTNGGVMSNNRGIPQQQPQPNSYFPNPVNGGVGEQVLSNGNSVLPSTTYPFDLNGGGGVGTMNAMNPGASAMQQGAQVPVQAAPIPPNMGAAPPTQPNSNNNPVIPTVDLHLESPYDGSSITQSAWNKAADKANNRSNPVAEVGKVLFDEIFSDDEVIACTLSGRGSTEKFNPNKVLFLKRAVAFLLTRPNQPWTFNVNTCDLTLSQEDESGTKGLDKKVFTEYRSRRRGDILKARNQNTS